jgi:hypothetical protein
VKIKATGSSETAVDTYRDTSRHYSEEHYLKSNDGLYDDGEELLASLGGRVLTS